MRVGMGVRVLLRVCVLVRVCVRVLVRLRVFVRGLARVHARLCVPLSLSLMFVCLSYLPIFQYILDGVVHWGRTCNY